MKNYNDLSASQRDSITRLFFYDSTLLMGGMGSGKTVVTLTAIDDLLCDGFLTRVLIVAPLKVADKVWRTENREWEHLQHLKVSVAIGTPKQRTEALEADADIYVVNFENLKWLKAGGWLDKFDGLVIDESTKMKSYGTWFKALKWSLDAFKWRVAMTGTLVSENIQQVFYQAYLVDSGAALGKSKERFLRKYFYPTDYSNRNWAPFEGAVEKIVKAMDDILYAMPDYRGDLPPLNIIDVPVDIGEGGRQNYSAMVKGFETAGVLAETAAAQSMKLEQLANGFIYTEDGETVIIHEAKARILREKFSFPFGTPGGSLLIVYQFEADLKVLRELFPNGECLNDNTDTVDRWNTGELPVMFLHPKSGGHGLNLHT